MWRRPTICGRIRALWRKPPEEVSVQCLAEALEPLGRFAFVDEYTAEVSWYWANLYLEDTSDCFKGTRRCFHMDEDRVEGYLSQITDIDDLPPLFETNEQIKAPTEGSWYDRAMVFGLGPVAAEALTQINTADRLKSAVHLMDQVRRLFDALVAHWLVREEVKHKSSE